MSKRQNQLMKTYLRQRENHIKNSSYETYKLYEIYFLYKMGVDISDKTEFMSHTDLVTKYPELYDAINLDKLSPSFFANLISRDPKYLDKTPKEKLLKLNSYYMGIIISSTKLSDIIKYDFLNKLPIHKLESEDIAFIILDEPKIIKLFPQEIINKINSAGASQLITQHPRLLKYFENHKLHKHQILDIIQHHPQLKQYFKERGVL